MYTIYTNIFNNHAWQECFTADTFDEKLMVKRFFYLRAAYPDCVVSLQKDGYIISTAELAKLAHYILE